MKLTDFQKEFILNNFFKDDRFPGWKNIGTALLENGECIVPGNSCIWIGGIGNFIKTQIAEDYVNCVEYRFNLQDFLSSAWFKEIKDGYQNKLKDTQIEVNAKAEKMVQDMTDEINDISNLESENNKPILRIYCGELVDDAIKQLSIESGFHPVKQFKMAESEIKIILDKKLNRKVTSNNPDYVSALYYLSEKNNIKCEIYLNGVLSTIEDVFGDWNRFYDLLQKATK